jgi:hypothetical protein
MTRAKASPILKSVVIHQLQVVAGEIEEDAYNRGHRSSGATEAMF